MNIHLVNIKYQKFIKNLLYYTEENKKMNIKKWIIGGVLIFAILISLFF